MLAKIGLRMIDCASILRQPLRSQTHETLDITQDIFFSTRYRVHLKKKEMKKLSPVIFQTPTGLIYKLASLFFPCNTPAST